MRNRPTFKLHDDFNFEHIKISDLSRETVELESRFEINESGRQANEQIREENEQGRQSAESDRVSNEEKRELNEVERISKDSERDSKIEAVEGVVDDVSSKLNNKANKKQEDWITPTLLNGFTGWAKYRMNQFGSLEIVGEIKSATATSQNLQVFSLAPQYSPANVYSKTISDNISTHALIGEVFIRTNGSVSITVNTNATFLLNEVLIK